MGINLMTFGKEVEYIDVDSKKIPCGLSIKLTDRTYHMIFKYNAIGDFFTVDLKTSQNELLAYGEIIRYGRPLFGTVEDERFPLPIIIPRCLTGDNIDTITYDNFDKEVKLYLHQRGTTSESAQEDEP